MTDHEMNQRPKHKIKNYKILREKITVNLHDLAFQEWILTGMTPKAGATKQTKWTSP